MTNGIVANSENDSKSLNYGELLNDPSGFTESLGKAGALGKLGLWDPSTILPLQDVMGALNSSVNSIEDLASGADSDALAVALFENLPAEDSAAGNDLYDVMSLLSEIGTNKRDGGDFKMPKVVVVKEDDQANSLPGDAPGAFVPGKDGESGTIMIDEKLLKGDPLPDGETLESVMLEEVGEAVAEYVSSYLSDIGSELKVAEGDVGDRIETVVTGGVLDMENDFDAVEMGEDGADEVLVRLNNEERIARAATEETVGGTLGLNDDYDITAGNYNTSGNDEDAELDLSPANSPTVKTTSDESGTTLPPNDLTFTVLEDSVIDDFDDALDGAFAFGNRTFYTNPNGDPDPNSYTEEAFVEVTDGSADLASIYNNMTQMAYGLEQIMVNLDDRFPPEEAETRFVAVADRVTEALSFEYNAAKGNRGDDIVTFGSLDEAIGQILHELKPGLQNFTSFIADIDDVRGDIASAESDETWLNQLLSVSSMLVAVGTGIGAVRSLSKTILNIRDNVGNTPGEYLSTYQDSIIGGGVSMGTGLSAPSDPGSTEIMDFSGLNALMLESREDFESAISEWADESDPNHETYEAFVSFGDHFQNAQYQVSVQDSSLAAAFGSGYEQPDGRLMWRDETHDNDAFPQMKNDLNQESLWVNERQMQPPARWAEGALAQEEKLARSEEFVVADNGEYLGIVEIPKVIRSVEEQEADAQTEKYNFQTAMNVDEY